MFGKGVRESFGYRFRERTTFLVKGMFGERRKKRPHPEGHSRCVPTAGGLGKGGMKEECDTKREKIFK